MVKRRRRRRNRTKRGRESKRRECLRIQNVLFEEMEEVEGDRGIVCVSKTLPCLVSVHVAELVVDCVEHDEHRVNGWVVPPHE